MSDETTLPHTILTAEQVRKAVERHGNIMDNRLYEDWQAAADELNATLGSETCVMETDSEELEVIASSPEDTWGYRCRACGWSFRYERGIKPRFCPDCRREVVDA